MNLDFVRGSIGGFGCGLIGWGFDTGHYFYLGLGIACFFGSYLIPLQSRT
jgi:hypothetical protein